MSRFYVLPPRTVVANDVALYLSRLLSDCGSASEAEAVLDAITEAAARRRDVYVVFRDELPPGADTREVLEQSFGAEPSDEIIEVQLPKGYFTPASAA